MQAMMLLFPLLFISIYSVSGYVYRCLDDCECDTSDEVIHCHNGERTTIQIPEGRLRGFPVIGLTYNKIIRLPNEKLLLNKFPDLKMIDVERNPDFDCSSLTEFEALKVISDCFRNVSDVGRVPPLYRPSEICDFACMAEKHYKSLHAYVLRLFEIVKEKYNNFNWDEAVDQVQVWIKDAVDRVNKFSINVQEKYQRSKLVHSRAQGREVEVEVPVE